MNQSAVPKQQPCSNNNLSPLSSKLILSGINKKWCVDFGKKKVSRNEKFCIILR